MNRATCLLRGEPGAAGAGALPAGFSELLDDLDSTGWSFSLDTTFRDGLDMEYRIWRSSDGRASLSYVEDYGARAHFLEFESDDPDALSRLSLLAAYHLDVVSLDELIEQARASEDPSILERLAIACPQRAEQRVVDILRQALGDERQLRRWDAAQAAAMLQWPALLDDLDRAARAETDRGTRRLLVLARNATSRLKEQG